MATLLAKVCKRDKVNKCTVIKREVTKKEIEEYQKKLRKIELEVEKRSNCKANKNL